MFMSLDCINEIDFQIIYLVHVWSLFFFYLIKIQKIVYHIFMHVFHSNKRFNIFLLLITIYRGIQILTQCEACWYIMQKYFFLKLLFSNERN